MEPTEEPTEERTPEEVLLSEIQVQIDALLMEYFGAKFANDPELNREEELTSDEILALINEMSEEEITAELTLLELEVLVEIDEAIEAIDKDVQKLPAEMVEQLDEYGIFGVFCEIVEELIAALNEEIIEEPVEVSAEMIAAQATLAAIAEKYVREYTEENYEAVMAELISGIELNVFAEETVALEAAMAALTEEELVQFETENAEVLAWLTAVKEQAAVEAVRAKLTALNVPEYTEETLWTVLDEVIAAKTAEEALDTYVAEINAAQEALNALHEEDKVALETEFAVQLSFAKLLIAKVSFDALVDAYYVDFGAELWILFETKLAVLSMDELVIVYNDINNAMSVVYALPEAELALFTDKYATELDFMMQYFAAINEKAGTPVTLANSSSRFDTSVTNGYYNILSEKDYNIISGVTETEIVMNNSDGTRRQVFRFFSIDTSSSSIELVPGYYQIDKYASDPTNKAYQKAAGVTDMAAYYESELGYDIVGGMNTALAYDSDAPYSFLMWEGKVLQDKNDSFGLGYDWLNQHSGACSTYIAIKKDGSVELRSGSEPFEEDDWNCVGANFGWQVKDGKNVASESRAGDTASRSMIGVKADGTLIFCQTDGRLSPTSIGQNTYEMGELMLALGCVNAFNCDGGGSSTFISQRAGESGLTMRSTPSDGSERPTIHAIFIAKAKGMTPGIFDYAQINGEYDYFAPHTTYSFTAEAIDTTGVAMEMPEGGVWTLSDDAFGTIDNGVFVSNGTMGEVKVQFTVGGKTSEYPITIVHPDSFSFGADGTVIPYGKSVTLTPTVLYGKDNWDVYYQADTFEWTFSDETVGTWDAETLTYTATTDESKNGPQLTVTYKYSDALAPVIYNLDFGKGSEIIAGWDFENGDVSDWMGFSDAKAWSIANGVNNTLVGSEPLAGQFSPENDAHTFLATAENGQVKNGKYALGVTYDNSDSSFRGWTYNVLFNVGETRVFRDVANGLNATTLGFWLYIPEGAAGLAFQSQFSNGSKCVQDHFMFTTVSGVRKNLNSCTEADIPANRWVYASIDISKYDYLSTLSATDESSSRSPSWMRTYIKPETPAKLTFYIDDITLDYSAAVEDRNAPVISDAKYMTADEGVALTDGAKITGNSVSFTAVIAESTGSGEVSGLNLSSAKIYIDGNEVETEATKNTMSTKDSVELTNGQHRVTFEIEDNWYNRTQLSYEVTVVGSEEALAELSGHNDFGNTPEADSVYYVDINTAAAEDVAMIEATIQLNTANEWELEHMIVAPGFEVEYMRLDDERYTVATFASTTDIHAVDNVVAITLTRTDDCQLTGEQTLLSIPVRVWSWDGFNNVTEQPEPAPANKPTVTIDYTILFGYVENNAGDVFDFGGSKSVATTMIGAAVPDGYTYHEHTVTALADKAATCTENGYADRTYCEVCGSVIEWGTFVAATGHNYVINNDILVCGAENCGEQLVDSGIVTVGEDKYAMVAGKLMTGWQSFTSEGYCYADPVTKKVYANCEFTVNGLNYTADENGITLGAWDVNYFGKKFSYGPQYYRKTWVTIDGEKYYFGSDNYAYTGYNLITDNTNNQNSAIRWFRFDDEGVLIDDLTDYYGFIEIDGSKYCVTAGQANYFVATAKLNEQGIEDAENGSYYCLDENGKVLTGTQYIGSYIMSKSKYPIATGTYEFDADGKMCNGVVEKEDGTYYYVNGKLKYAGWVEYNGNRYAFDANGKALVGKQWVGSYLNSISINPYKTGYFVFDSTGKLANGVVHLDDVSYYCVDGVPKAKGLVEVDGIFYYADEDGTLATGRIWVGTYPSNGLLPAGYYEFGADGAMLNGIVEKEDGVYYYEQGKPVNTGWLKVGDDYYVFTDGGKALVGKHWVGTYLTQTSRDPFKVGNFTFDENGKLANGVIETEDGLYYYQNGTTQYQGLIYVDGKYYLVGEGGKLTVGNVWVGTYDSNDLLPRGYYEFTATGEMAEGIVEKADGLYYYERGRTGYKGVIERNGEYYYVESDGKLVIGYVWVGSYASNGLLNKGYYTFGADGALLDGFEMLDDGLYYYTMGVARYYGLKIIDAELYYINEGGKVETGRVYVGTYASNGLIPKGYYNFGEDGKLIK